MIKLTEQEYKAFIIFQSMTEEERKQFISEHKEGSCNNGKEQG